MKSQRTLSLWLGILLPLLAQPAANANNAGAVVLVNSQSARYVDFSHFIQPYLGNFGVPYTVLDISSTPIGASLTNYALIIVGHAQLDTNNTYLTPAVQSNISLAVSNGVGLVSFDNVLAATNKPIYQFEQDVFELTYTNPVTSGAVSFPPTEAGSTMHYITSLHLPNETLTLSNANNVTTMAVTGLKLPGSDTAVATCGGAPFVVIAKYGQGRAVQWTSYAWMSSTVQGPVNGLDDLLWRGFVWAARKPFVMRGMPHFATMRIDDVTGNMATSGSQPPAFWWVHEMTNAGFKPWLALFIDDISYASQTFPGDGRLTDLSNLVASGRVTASVHSFSATQSGATNFFYFNHATESQYSDAEMAQNFQRGTAFLANNGIPSSKVVIAHYSEVGTNAFNGLTNWGVQFFMIEVVPGTVEYASPGAPWLVAGPYRLYEATQPGQVNMPMYYADWLTVPNHPELNGKLFNCYTEIRNVGADGEWAPADGDVPSAISRGYQMLKRGFDSMTLGNIFTHEFFIGQSDGPQYPTISTNNFATILSGITNDVASYNPIYVTLDYGSQYVRATRTSQITSGDYDSATGQISATFSGYTDLPITAYYYTGADSAITNIAGTVPVFTGSTNVTLAQGLPALYVSANATNRPYWTTNPVLTYSITGFQGTDTVAVVSGSAGLSTTAATNSPAGAYPISVTNINLSASNYNFVFLNSLLTVTPATLQVAAGNQSRSYGATNPALTYTLSGFLGADTVAVVSGTPALSTTADTNSSVGAYVIAVTNGTLNASNYNFNFTNGTLTIGQAVLQVTPNPQSRLYGANNPALTYTLSGFLGTDTVAVVSGSAGLSTAAAANSPIGAYPINVTNINLLASNYGFNFSTNTLTVAPATLLVAANNQSRSYGATNPALTYTLSGFLGTDTVAAVSGAPALSTTAGANSPAGAYAIAVANGNLSASNYNFNLANGTLTISQAMLQVSADPQGRMYNATNPVLTYTLSGFLGTDTVAVVSGSAGLNTTAVINSPVGAYPIGVTNINLLASNYGFNFLSNVLTVTPAPLLVTADNQSRPYGVTNPALTYTLSGFLGTDTVAAVSGGAGTSTMATANSPVGTYPITVTNINLNASNYNFSFASGTLTIGQATLLVAADPHGRMYNMMNPALTYTLSGFLGTDTVVVVTGGAGTSTTATADSDVGTYPITVTNINLFASNYGFSFTNNVLTVTPAPLLVTADNQTRPYGVTNPALSFTMSGYQGTDTVTVVSGAPALSTTADTNSPVGAYVITVTNGNVGATNYTFTFNNGTLNVTATAPTILSLAGAGTTNVVITWSALSNATYRVRYRNDFSTNWQNLIPDVTATNAAASLTNNPGSDPQRFYQVLVP